MKTGMAIALAVAAMSVAGCGKHDNANTSDTANSALPDNGTAADNGVASDNSAATTPAASPDQAFVNTAAASDAFEIQSSQLAATNASSSGVKSFAKHMIDAHTASTAKLKTAAASASPAITPAPALTADQQQKLDQLKSQTGAAFDSAYIDDQVAAHQATLDALRSYSSSGGVPALKSFATQMIPTVTAHLNSAKALKH